jgi:hypothetical protein
LVGFRQRSSLFDRFIEQFGHVRIFPCQRGKISAFRPIAKSRIPRP